MKTMDLAEFNTLLKNPYYHPLYSALEAMSVDELIEFLHRAGFKCGTAQEFKRVILWAVSDELVAKKLAALELKPSKKITPVQFCEFLKKIHGYFIAIESSELADSATARKVTKLIDKLEELRRLDRYSDHDYVSDQIVTAVELRMHRWLWRYQSLNKTLPIVNQDLQAVDAMAKSPAPSLIPLLNSIVNESRAVEALKNVSTQMNRTR